MTTQAKSKFQGVTELRPALHGPLLDRKKSKDEALDTWDCYQCLIEDEPRPVNFEETLSRYGIQGESEKSFLAGLAAIPGGAEDFLMTVVLAPYHVSCDRPMGLQLLQWMYENVQYWKAQNAMYSPNGITSTQCKGWVYSNVSNALSKDFKRGMDQQQRSNHHDR